MITSEHNGNSIYWDILARTWKYTENDLPIDRNIKNCPKCGKLPTKEGHDACLGTLPGVKFACCGHGKRGYIYFENGVIIRGIFDEIINVENEEK